MKGARSRGYTIIEVMIVLAVSGLMFVIAAQFINGKQANSAFRQGVNEMASRVQATIDEVSNGKYSDAPLYCQVSGGSVQFPPVLPNKQGTNSDCVFLGKFLHLAEHVGGGGLHNYEVIPVAGSRLNVSGSGAPATNLTEAGATFIPSLITQETVPQQLDVTQVKYNNGAGSSYGVGFVQGQGGLDNGALDNGSQDVSLYVVPGLLSNKSTPFATGLINGANLASAAVDSVQICLSDGTRYAEIILGTNNNRLTVRTHMEGTTPCP